MTETIETVTEHTATLKEAYQDWYSEDEHCIVGRIYGDVKRRWADGEWIHTSTVIGAIGKNLHVTLNSIYKVEWEKK